MSKPLFCLMGPTASGKTDLACRLAEQFPCEIISVDSAMVYRGMDIGTAKPDAQTLARIPHHLIDILNPDEPYSVAQFRHDVMVVCEGVWSRGCYPLLVGGTMMYFNALQRGLSTLPQADPVMRTQLMMEAEEYGWGCLHNLLTTIDPLTASKVHKNDTQRIQRAIEVYRLTGKPLSSFWKSETVDTPQCVNFLLLPQSRAELHERIATRFHTMLADGFIEEVDALIGQWSLSLEHPSMRCVGYRQVYHYLENHYDYNTLKERGIIATRQLAKRQFTWLRHWSDGYVLSETVDLALVEMLSMMEKEVK